MGADEEHGGDLPFHNLPLHVLDVVTLYRCFATAKAQPFRIRTARMEITMAKYVQRRSSGEADRSEEG